MSTAWITIALSVAMSLFTSGMVTGRVLSKIKDVDTRLARIENLYRLVPRKDSE